MNKHLETIKDNKPMQVGNQEDGDFYLLFIPQMWDQVIFAAEQMAEQVEFWKREFDLELAHAKHAEEHIIELEKKIAELEASLKDAEGEANNLVVELNKYRIENTRLREYEAMYKGLYK